MKQHKWHKEIKAWADGAKIQFKDSKASNQWLDCIDNDPAWEVLDFLEYRIKPQPKDEKPQPFLGFKEIPYKDWVLRFYKMPNDLWYTEGINDEWMDEMVEASKPQPKVEKPKYLYVYADLQWDLYSYKLSRKEGDFGQYIGKIKLETDDHGD